MTRTTLNGKGQVFSIDVLFMLLPVMMIMGASLQYLYLAEEQAQSFVLNSRLELSAQAMASYVVSDFHSSGDPFVNTSNCQDLKSSLRDAENLFADGEPYAARVFSYFNNTAICKSASDDLWGNCPGSCVDYYSLDLMNNTAASDLRFMIEYNGSTGVVSPGRIAGISFIRWEKTP